GALLGDYDGSWLAVNGQPVAYYHSDTVDDGENYSISGRIPALLNGERVELIVVFDNANPDGYVAGAVFDYRDGETETVAKNIVSISDGDVIDFLCDYYDYDGNYSDSYMLGDRLTVDGELVISNVYLPDASAAHASYVFTDIFAQEYWTPPLPQR
ncbi:MAG TPA: peptidase C11, partial [Bacillota bacterium]|nr:peptidase C11 [Bacillota bacterium]